MTLATTCPSCKTSFRVVADQLKLRRGMVRCGVCQNVFNGLEQLRYVDAQIPAKPPATARPDNVPNTSSFPAARRLIEDWDEPNQHATDNSRSESTEDPFVKKDTANGEQPKDLHTDQKPAENSREVSFDKLQASIGVPPSVIATNLSTTVSEPIAKIGPDTIHNSTLTRLDEEQHTAFFLPESAPTHIAAQSLQPPRSIQYGASVVEPSTDEEAVDFFSSETSHGTVNQRARKALLTIGVITLSTTLILQVLMWGRNWIASRFPVTRPALESIAGALGQKVELQRNLKALSIESFDVQSIPQRDDVLAVSMILRNQSRYPVAWPAIELTLFDADRKPVLRKILMPHEYLNQVPNPNGVPSNSELPIRLGLHSEPLNAKGYNATIFYN